MIFWQKTWKPIARPLQSRKYVIYKWQKWTCCEIQSGCRFLRFLVKNHTFSSKLTKAWFFDKKRENLQPDWRVFKFSWKCWNFAKSWKSRDLREHVRIIRKCRVQVGEHRANHRKSANKRMQILFGITLGIPSRAPRRISIRMHFNMALCADS